jgi:hypothetical protein
LSTTKLQNEKKEGSQVWAVSSGRRKKPPKRVLGGEISLKKQKMDLPSAHIKGRI